MPVQHGGHLAGTAGPAGTTLAELGAGLGADLYLGHGRTPDVICSYVCVVTQHMRCRARGCVGTGPNTAPITAPDLDGHAQEAPSPWQPRQLTRGTGGS